MNFIFYGWSENGRIIFWVYMRAYVHIPLWGVHAYRYVRLARLWSEKIEWEFPLLSWECVVKATWVWVQTKPETWNRSRNGERWKKRQCKWLSLIHRLASGCAFFIIVIYVRVCVRGVYWIGMYPTRMYWLATSWFFIYLGVLNWYIGIHNMNLMKVHCRCRLPTLGCPGGS